MIITFKGNVHKCSFRQKEIHVKQQQEIQVFRHFMGADYILQLTPDFHWNKQDSVRQDWCFFILHKTLGLFSSMEIIHPSYLLIIKH